ncbi:aminotransferase class I/II-fold pyridoxal phosphate-dependent enzyme [Acetobacterium malicum]|uniref:methionine gamma-lyase family protein n=1 Tax=Acetobacterium malicum TaxID=52692 RepID=UPI000687D21F|nr:methionine gamma-lyase family protein [Acetobacterium dehalogenans]
MKVSNCLNIQKDIKTYLEQEFEISAEVIDFVKKVEDEVHSQLKKRDDLSELHQYRVIKAMQKAGLGDRHFTVSTGYGYDDVGREVVETIYADVFGAEDALVRPHISSGTHAISLALYGVLRPGDHLLAITGSPYDTIRSVIGLEEACVGQGTIKEFGVTYDQIELLPDGSFDETAIVAAITANTKMIYLQRSTGYSWRAALSIDDMAAMIKKIRAVKADVVIFVDNCYGEFLDRVEPVSIGADLMAGSLIKNPGGGLAPTGGYVAGRADLVHLAACRLAAPGVARETGATLGINRTLLQGLFLAPTVVAQAIKSAVLLAACYKKLGFAVCPEVMDYRSDIIQSVCLKTAEGVKTFCRAIQEAAPVDSQATPEPWDMPGYSDPIIMAAGAFIQGSSIELSADAPMREPYYVYFQGGLTHFHGKLGILLSLQRLLDKQIVKI